MPAEALKKSVADDARKPSSFEDPGPRFCKPEAVEEARAFAHGVTASAGCDGSHDWNHICRVHKNVQEIAREENLSDSKLRLVEVIAFLHDVADSKYPGHEDRGRALNDFLLSQVKRGRMSTVDLEVVRFVLERMSFKDESKGSCEGVVLPIELKVVQDADRLDAIGAVGIARCFMFGGSKGSSLIEWGDPKDEETSDKGIVYKSCVGHFYEKLLKLKTLMKTKAGAALAESRHQVMVDFLSQIEEECNTSFD